MTSSLRAASTPPFLWGAATSSHQVEGNNDGNDWAAWERAGRVTDGSGAGNAAAWWAGHAENDLSLAAELGHNAHRLSLEWSRIEPQPGVFNADAIARYRRLLRHANRCGLAVMVTLNHFTLPHWVGPAGWCDPALPEAFTRFATHAAFELKDDVALWVTLNEPNVLALFGYADTVWPPGQGSFWAAAKALTHQLEAHARAYRALKEKGLQAPVGLVLSLPFFAPARRRHPLDEAVCALQDWSFDGALLHGLRRGWVPPPYAVWPRSIPGLAGALDFIGLNYYGRYDVRFDPSSTNAFKGAHVQTPTVRTETNDWGQPFPEGLRRQLHRLTPLDVPIYVTENGTCDPDDHQRGDFIRNHVGAMLQARDEGVDVRGYFHWSLIDNFEWAEGWGPHFGLIALDREHQTRTPRNSAYVYQRICEAQGARREGSGPMGVQVS